MIAFVNCVIDNKASGVNEEDAVKAFQIALAATQSAGEKKLIEIA